jgi:hypothetical protein
MTPCKTPDSVTLLRSNKWVCIEWVCGRKGSTQRSESHSHLNLCLIQNFQKFSPNFRNNELRSQLTNGDEQKVLLLYVGRLGAEKNLKILKQVS